MTHVTACGIDPGKHWAIAIVEYPGDRVIITCEGETRAHGLAALRTLDFAGKDAGRRVLAVENQFVAKNVSTAIKVAHRAGEWAGVGWLCGWGEAVYVLPQTWRSAYKRLGRTAKRRWSKRDSVAHANAIFQLELKTRDHDLAEALLIARWAAVRKLHTGRTP